MSYSSAALRGGSYNSAALRGGSYNSAALRGGSYNSAALRGGSYNSAALRGGSYNSAALRGGIFCNMTRYGPASHIGGYFPPPHWPTLKEVVEKSRFRVGPRISPMRRGIKPFIPSVIAVPPTHPDLPLDSKTVVKAPSARQTPLKYMLDNGLTPKDL